MGPPNFGSISQWVILDSSSRCSPLIAFLCTHALLLQTTLPCTSFADGLSSGATFAKYTYVLSSHLAIWVIWSPSRFQEADHIEQLTGKADDSEQLNFGLMLTSCLQLE